MATKRVHTPVGEQQLYDHPVFSDIRAQKGRTAFTHAVRTCHGDVADLLLVSEWVDPKSPDAIYGRTPMYDAAEKGYIESSTR